MRRIRLLRVATAVGLLLVILTLAFGLSTGPSRASTKTSHLTPAEQVKQDFNRAQDKMRTALKKIDDVENAYGTVSTQTSAADIASDAAVPVDALELLQGAVLNVNFTKKTRLDAAKFAIVITFLVYHLGVAYLGAQDQSLLTEWSNGLVSLIKKFESSAKTVAGDLGYTLG